MLDLDDTTRTRLRAKGTLIVDDEGDEVLAGLTVAESQFLLLFEQHPSVGFASAESSLYFHLKHKHLMARCARIHRAMAQLDSSENDSPT